MEALRQFRNDLRHLIRSLGVLQARYPELGLGVTQCHALLELEDQQRSVGELSQLLQIEASSASRNLATLERHGWVAHSRDPEDPRRKCFRLTASGRTKVRAIHRRGDRVALGALECLLPDEQRAVGTALDALARAVDRSQNSEVRIRASHSRDNAAIARVIREVLTELDLTDATSAFAEPTTDCIHDTYVAAGGRYFVVTRGREVEGGGGILPLDDRLCELKNLYFTQRLRGGGHSKRLVNRLLRYASQRGFREVFLETRSEWRAAAELYRRFGFEACAKPACYAGHAACNQYLSLRLG